MLISELILVLEARKERWGDIEVLLEWESTFHEVEQQFVYKMEVDKDRPDYEQRGHVLLIDADEGFYKEAYAEDQNEGEAPDEPTSD